MQQKQVQQQNIKDQKDTFYREYEGCKESSSQEYSFNWLRRCNIVKPLSKECAAILKSGIPWKEYYLYRAFLKSPSISDVEKDGFNKYVAFREQVDGCSCETLPKFVADSLNNELDKAVKSCEREFDVKLKTLE